MDFPLYQYASGDLLSKPNTYFYTKFSGVDFIKEWKSQRQSVITKLVAGDLVSVPSPTISTQEIWHKLSDDNVVDTKEILEAVISLLSFNKISEDILLKKIIDRLIKKFEVSKRWHNQYAKYFLVIKEKKDDPDSYSNLDLYLLGAQVFDLAFRQTDALPCLNVLLKSNDTICSQLDKLNPENKSKLSLLLTHEMNYIESLMAQIKLSVL